jgi:hypothetical protein
MNSRGRLLTLLALIVLVAIGGALSWGFENQVIETKETSEVAISYSEGACESNGVSIVVDFGAASNSESIVRCANNFSGNSWELFRASNLSVAGTKQYPVGFVCRIENFPIEEAQNCLDTPKYSEGSWAFFFMDEALGWRVSGVGSVARSPSCGGADGWLFLAPGQQSGEVLPRLSPEVINCED